MYDRVFLLWSVWWFRGRTVWVLILLCPFWYQDEWVCWCGHGSRVGYMIRGSLGCPRVLGHVFHWWAFCVPIWSSDGTNGESGVMGGNWSGSGGSHSKSGVPWRIVASLYMVGGVYVHSWRYRSACIDSNPRRVSALFPIIPIRSRSEAR